MVREFAPLRDVDIPKQIEGDLLGHRLKTLYISEEIYS